MASSKPTKVEVVEALVKNRARNRNRKSKKVGAIVEVDGRQTFIAPKGQARVISEKTSRRAQKRGATQVNIGGRIRNIGASNRADPRNRLRSLGRTGPGRAWAVRALHPCGEDLPGQVSGIPDRVTEPVATLEGRSFDNVPMPNLPDRTFGSGSTAYTLSSPWKDAKIWHVEGLQIASARGRIILQASPDGVFINAGFQPARRPSDDFVSGTWYRNPVTDPASASAEIPPGYWNAVMTLEVPVLPRDNAALNAASLYQKFRVCGMGLTVDLDVATLQNQGRLVAGQLGCDAKYVPVNDKWATAVSSDPNSVTGINVPISDGDLTSLDPLASNHLAKEGLYMPLRAGQPTFDMRDTIAYKSGSGNDPNTFIVNNAQWDASPSLWHSPIPWSDEIDPSWSIGVFFFLGISSEATLDMKIRIVWECMVSSKSVWSPFAKRSPRYDPIAIDAYAVLAQELGHAYPASFNNLNKMLTTIAGAIGSLGIPVVSQVAKAIEPFAGTIGDFLESIF